MNTTKIIDAIVELAKEVDSAASIDFGMLSVSEDEAFRTVAIGILREHLTTEINHREVMLLAVATHLVVENMVLNLKLMQKG